METYVFSKPALQLRHLTSLFCKASGSKVEMWVFATLIKLVCTSREYMRVCKNENIKNCLIDIIAASCFSWETVAISFLEMKKWRKDK